MARIFKSRSLDRASFVLSVLMYDTGAKEKKKEKQRDEFDVAEVYMYELPFHWDTTAHSKKSLS